MECVDGRIRGKVEPRFLRRTKTVLLKRSTRNAHLSLSLYLAQNSWMG